MHSTADIMGFDLSMVFNVDRPGHSTADLMGLKVSMVFNVKVSLRALHCRRDGYTCNRGV